MLADADKPVTIPVHIRLLAMAFQVEWIEVCVANFLAIVHRIILARSQRHRKPEF